MLRRIEWTHPIDDHVGAKIWKNVVSQNGVRPVHQCTLAARFRRSAEAADDGVAGFLRESSSESPVEHAVNDCPSTVAGIGIQQQPDASRAGTQRDQLSSISLKDLTESLNSHHSSAGILEFQ